MIHIYSYSYRRAYLPHPPPPPPPPLPIDTQQQQQQQQQHFSSNNILCIFFFHVMSGFQFRYPKSSLLLMSTYSLRTGWKSMVLVLGKYFHKQLCAIGVLRGGGQGGLAPPPPPKIG